MNLNFNVMDAKQKQRLINALKKAGMSVGLADSYEGLEDAALESVIKGLEGAGTTTPTMEQIVASEGFTKFIENGGFDKLLANNKAAQSQYDSKLSKATKTRIENILKGDGEGEAGGQGKGAAGAAAKLPDDTPAWAKTLLEQSQVMRQELDGLKQAREGEKTLDQAKVLLGKSKLPDNIQEKWLSRINVNSEDSLEDQVKGLETEWNEINPGGNQGGSGSGDYNFQQGDKSKQGELSSTDKESLKDFAKNFKVN